MYKLTIKLMAHKRIKFVNKLRSGSSVVGNLMGTGNYIIASDLFGDISEASSTKIQL
jgi:hypothetical protein